MSLRVRAWAQVPLGGAATVSLTDVNVRRIITGHDGSGRAVILCDEPLAGSGPSEDKGRTALTPNRAGCTRRRKYENHRPLPHDRELATGPA